jgi:hypothetical protein
MMYKGIDFLVDCYDAEHTLSLNDAVDDLTLVCKSNGGSIKGADSMILYNGSIYDKIRYMYDSETGLYRESGGYVYELYKTEREHGHLVQTEI